MRISLVVAVLGMLANTITADLVDVVELDGANNDPKQPHVPARLQAKGYPKEKAPEPKSEGLQGVSDHLADVPVYPGGGKMTAEDIRVLFQEIEPYLQVAQQGKAADQKYSDQKAKLHEEMIKSLTASTAEGVQGAELLSGKIEHELGLLKGNLGLCQKKLSVCKTADIKNYQDMQKVPSKSAKLGEGQSPNEIDVTSPTTTALEDDRIARGVKDPAADTKNKHGLDITTTAQQDYVESQRTPLFSLVPHPPGKKFKHDRMTQNEVRMLVSDVVRQLNASNVEEMKENADALKQVESASTQAMSALTGLATSKSLTARANAVPQTAAVLKSIADTNENLLKCLDDVKKHCTDETKSLL